MRSYGERIKDYRVRKSIKQVDLARMLNISQSSMSDLEKSTYPPLNRIEQVCEALNISMEDFFAENIFEKIRGNKLPSYITQDDAEALRVLNVDVSADNRILAKEMFANVLELALRASGQHV